MNILNADNILYLISNLFCIYILFRFMSLFFDRSYANKKTEIIAFGLYYCIISIMYLMLSSPLINLGMNVLLLFLATFIYPGRISTRLIAIFLIYSTAMIIDSIVYNIVVKAEFFLETNNFSGILSNLLLFMIVLIFERVFKSKTVQGINTVHWVAILLIPMGSIMIVVTAFLYNYESISTIMIVSILLGVNVIVFSLYDLMLKYYEDKYEKELLKQQNKAYGNQFEIIKTSQKNLEMIRHDMKNHMHAIRNMLENNEKLALLGYLDNISEYTDIMVEYVNSGNKNIDSILNYKIHEAEKAEADIDLDINIPDEIKIDAFDLNVILGNLIDNAVDAIKISEKKDIKVKIEMNRSVLFIKIMNSYNGRILKTKHKILTTKKDKDGHGIGLDSVENILKKYDGIMDIDYENNIFEVGVLMYNPTLA